MPDHLAHLSYAAAYDEAKWELKQSDRGDWTVVKEESDRSEAIKFIQKLKERGTERYHSLRARVRFEERHPPEII